MGATVKTLLENQDELFWGSYHDDPNYHFGISLDFRDQMLIVLAVYVMSDCDEDDEMLVTPELLAECYTIEDLENHGIVLSTRMGEDDDDAIGWYCGELSVFKQSELEAIRESSESLDGYLDIVIRILKTDPNEIEGHLDDFEDDTFFEMQSELESIPTNIDEGKLVKPLPFEFRLVGDALLGWQFASEEDYR
ncbi:hypothetical protein [Raoultibacter phocaeensis]|uniref:hypothetical protein n=1 Tax=Raoultibacter phocaeensis TaxID=2479841 RepID=UPI001119E218|nr:hypothetical protein [Raoultibacter phocaeensis]